MADSASMSLDEYIKKKKIKRPGPGAGRGPRVQTQKKGQAQGNKKKLNRTFGYNIKNKGNRWNTRVKRAGAKGGGNINRGSNQRVARNFRYFDNRSAVTKNYKQGSFGGGIRKRYQNRAASGGGGNVQVSQAVRRQLLKQLQTSQRVLTGRGGRINRNRNRVGINNKVKVNNLGKLKKFKFQNKAKNTTVAMAQQRIKKARNLLATRRRILGNSKAVNSTVSGRIRFGKFGLRTTQKSNYVDAVLTMQEKIRKAQLVRQRFHNQISPIIHQNTQRAPRQRTSRAIYNPQNTSRILFQQPNFHSSNNGLYSDRMADERDSFVGSVAGGGRTRQFALDDNWANTPRRVINTQYVNAGFSGASASGGGVLRYQQPLQEQKPGRQLLDPEIQSRISFIQEQARRTRPEDYDSYIEPDFRPVTTSRMTIGDRFRKLMN